MRTPTQILGAVAVAGLLAAGGSAFTAGNSSTAGAAQVNGYSKATVTGADVSAITYGYSDDRSSIDSVTFTLATPLSTSATAQVQLAASGDWTTCAARTDPADDITCTLGTPLARSAQTQLALDVHSNADSS